MRRQSAWLTHPIWTILATLAAIFSLSLALVVWFNPSPATLFTQKIATFQPPPSPAPIPRLKSPYNGRITWLTASYSQVWYMNSQDQEGNITLTVTTDFVFVPSYPCTGTITNEGTITFHCKAKQPSSNTGTIQFTGSLSPDDGHIDGKEVLDSITYNAELE